MNISEKKKNFILKSKKIAKRGALYSIAVFAFAYVLGIFLTNGSVLNILGNISVFSVLVFALSAVCLFLLQIEAWEKDLV